MDEADLKEVPSGLRLAAELSTQADLAAQVLRRTGRGVGVVTISRAENGHMISGSKADLIASTLGIPTARYVAAIEYRRARRRVGRGKDRLENFRGRNRTKKARRS